MLLLHPADFDNVAKQCLAEDTIPNAMRLSPAIWPMLGSITIDRDLLGIVARGHVRDSDHPEWGHLSLAEWAEKERARIEVLPTPEQLAQQIDELLKKAGRSHRVGQALSRELVLPRSPNFVFLDSLIKGC